MPNEASNYLRRVKLQNISKMSKASIASDRKELLHGLKKVTLQNWQTPDLPTMFSGITAEFCLSHVMHPKLNPQAPEIVEQLFEVARGSMVYGWFLNREGKGS